MVPEISSATDRIFCHFGLFFPFCSPNNLENQNFEKVKEAPGDIIILHMGNINDNYMIYIWFLRYEVQHTEFFCYLGLFFVLLQDI